MNLPRLALLACLAVALGLVAGPAHAEEDGPVYGASDLALEEDGLAKGWAMVYEELEGTPGEKLEGWVTDTAREAGIDEDALYCETRILQGPDGAAATLVVVEVEGELRTLPQDLARRGSGLGYHVQELGHPSRLLVLAAPEAVRAALLEMQRVYSVRTLARLGFERMNKGSHVGAVSYAKGARSIDAKAGAPLVVLGMVATREGKLDEAIEAFRIGFAQTSTTPAKGRLAMRGWAHYGKACLLKEDASLYREARVAMEKAVAMEGSGDVKEDPLFIQRYNLACAHSRLEETDEALAQLAKALEMAKIRMGTEGLKKWIEEHVRKDPDLEPIRDHPGFEVVLRKAAGGDTTGGL